MLKQNNSNMETQEAVKNQSVTKGNKVIPQNTAKAEKLIKQADNKKADNKKATDKPAKAPKARAESNEALGERLLKEKASQEQIIAAYTKVYKEKKGIVDKKFVEARAAIYMKIAAKRAAAKEKAK